MRLSQATALPVALLLLSTAGCSYLFNAKTDPLTREGVWTPNHSNRSNLVAEVVAPADLTRGTGDASTDGQRAAVAVDRLRNNKVRLLPNAGLAQIGGQPDAQGSGAGNN